MRNTLLCFLLALGVAAGIVTTVHHASAEPPPATDTAEHPYRPLIAQADIQVDAGAVVVPAFDAGSASTPTATPAPSEKLPNPVDDPFAAIDSLKAQKKQGWAVTILAAICMLTAGFSRAADKWPSSKLFAWFKKKKTAIYVVSGLSLTSAAAFNALALGGTWMAAAYAAAGAFFTMLHPGTPSQT